MYNSNPPYNIDDYDSSFPTMRRDTSVPYPMQIDDYERTKRELGRVTFNGKFGSTDHLKTKKTRLCNRYDSPEGCPFGDNCNYAHGISDLNKRPCTYGNSCFKVCPVCDDDPSNNSLGMYTNKDCNNICYFVHPGETDDGFTSRISKNKQGILKQQGDSSREHKKHINKRSFDQVDNADEYEVVNEKDVVNFIMSSIATGTDYIKIRVKYTDENDEMDIDTDTATGEHNENDEMDIDNGSV